MITPCLSSIIITVCASEIIFTCMRTLLRKFFSEESESEASSKNE